MRALSLAGGLAALCACGIAGAHSFGRQYNLPVPFWLYAWGATAALVLSFVVTGWFVTQPAAPVPAPAATDDRGRLAPGPAVLGVVLLLLTIVTGLVGTNNPYTNFSMTFFWIVFVLGLAYLTVVIGDVYATLNPWRALAVAAGRVWPGLFRGRLRYPPALSYAPALVLYMAFIWIELFGAPRPFPLAIALTAYTMLTLAGAALFGPAWFRHGEFFGVFFAVLGRMAPRVREGGRWRWQVPCAGLLGPAAVHPSLLLFVLFMLSSTAIDGLRESAPWVMLYWQKVAPLIVAQLGGNAVDAYPLLRSIYGVWQSAALVLSPFVYLGAYLLALQVARALAGSRRPLRDLALEFAWSLVPIVFVYHLTHYYTLLAGQGPQIVRLVSDPFGWGWNLFGTATWLRGGRVPDAAFVWHFQVITIVAGHVVSVWIAHAIALRLFAGRRQALLSQLPMLLLMVLFTAFGLWILSQPLAPPGAR